MRQLLAVTCIVVIAAALYFVWRDYDDRSQAAERAATAARYQAIRKEQECVKTINDFDAAMKGPFSGRKPFYDANIDDAQECQRLFKARGIEVVVDQFQAGRVTKRLPPSASQTSP